MKTHLKLIKIIVCLQILFASTTFAQDVTAEFDKDGTVIIVFNGTKNNIVIFQNSAKEKKFLDTGDGIKRHDGGFEINTEKISEIIGCNFFIYRGGHKFYEISPGGNESIPLKNPKQKLSSFFCYEKIDGKIAKKREVIIDASKKPDADTPPKKEEKPTVTSSETNPSTPTTPPPAVANPSPDPKKPAEQQNKDTAKPAEQPVQTKTPLQICEEEYQKLHAEWDPLMNKEAWNFSEKEKNQLHDFLEPCRLLKEKVKKIVPHKNAKIKTEAEKKTLLQEIDKLIAQITETMRKISDIEKIQQKYDTEVVSVQNEIIAQLKEKQNKINLSIQQAKKKYKLIQWREKDSLLSKIQVVKNQIREDSLQFNIENEIFISIVSQNRKASGVENFVFEQKNAIINDYKDISFRIQQYEKEVSKMNIPYTEIIIYSAIFLLILVALIFYIRAYFRKKTLAIQAKKNLDYNMRPIEDIKGDHNSNLYSAGLTEVKKQAGTDYYLVNMKGIFDDTAIETIYIKRKCIADIYHFLTDFKLSGNSNEIGCFIIGQWEYASPEKNTYNISLEEIIKPGSDAIYGEYELNFGVEIGVGLESAIFGLRQKTEKEYVHTSWLHTHPGLGLFLSLHDLNVQSQLSYSEHKNRMLAIVIDSNTEDLNMAFFTPKKNGNMNNKENLKRELSLKHIYQWVVSKKNI